MHYEGKATYKGVERRTGSAFDPYIGRVVTYTYDAMGWDVKAPSMDNGDSMSFTTTLTYHDDGTVSAG